MTSLHSRASWVTVLVILLSGAAQAQQVPAWNKKSDLRFFGMANLTFGGDTMTTFTLGGKPDKIKAGESVHVAVGASYTIHPAWAASASIGYHFDSGVGSDGDISFSRVPVEVMVHYNVRQQLALGFGARRAGGAEMTTSGVANNWSRANRGDYKASTGVIMEAEYFFYADQKMSVVGRFVQENFTHTASGNRYNGNHVGIGLKAYF